MDRRTWLRSALALLAGGCMRTAKRLDTPAAKLDTFALRHKEPDERFYAIVFSSQSIPRRPALTHTFATVIRAVDRPGQPPALDHHTISWMPATLDIRTLSLRVEQGVNLGLRESIEHALETRQRVSMWGPYETHASFYRRFLVQKQFMETSGVGYQCADALGEAPRTGRGCCCIHAITDMDPTYDRTSFPLVWHGDSASEHIANRLHKGSTIIQPQADHSWLLEPLGLCAYPIKRRCHGDRLLEFPRVPMGSRSAPLPPRPAPTGGGRPE